MLNAQECQRVLDRIKSEKRREKLEEINGELQRSYQDAMDYGRPLVSRLFQKDELNDPAIRQELEAHGWYIREVVKDFHGRPYPMYEVSSIRLEEEK